MDRPVELVPLLCLRCSSPIPAQPDEIAWVCAQCGQGSLLDEKQGLVPLDILYSSTLAPQARGKPFWVSSGRVAMQRETFKGNQARDAENFWRHPRLFYIPAYDCSLDILLSLGKQLLLKQAVLQEGSPAPFEPVVLPLDDVRSATEFIVMNMEAERKDKLRRVNFVLDLQPPVLWILP